MTIFLPSGQTIEQLIDAEYEHDDGVLTYVTKEDGISYCINLPFAIEREISEDQNRIFQKGIVHGS